MAVFVKIDKDENELLENIYKKLVKYTYNIARKQEICLRLGYNEATLLTTLCRNLKETNKEE